MTIYGCLCVLRQFMNLFHSILFLRSVAIPGGPWILGHWHWRGRMYRCLFFTVDHRVFVQLEGFRFGWENQGKEGSQSILTTKVVV